MSGMAGDNRSSYDETSDPITPTLHDSPFIDHTKESGSSVAEQIAAAMQPGDTSSTTRRVSDLPRGMRAQEWQESFPGDGEGEGEGERERDGGSSGGRGRGRGMLQAAQETVAKALGGGSRGAG